MFNEKKYLPVICYVDENKKDIGGNIYPTEGFISARKFTDDINIEYGLYGIPWGKTKQLLYEKINKGYWAVIKTEINRDLVKTDFLLNRVKFKQGMILYFGNIYNAGNFLYNEKDNPEHRFCSTGYYLKEEDILGTNEWMKKYNDN